MDKYLKYRCFQTIFLSLMLAISAATINPLPVKADWESDMRDKIFDESYNPNANLYEYQNYFYDSGFPEPVSNLRGETRQQSVYVYWDSARNAAKYRVVVTIDANYGGSVVYDEFVYGTSVTINSLAAGDYRLTITTINKDNISSSCLTWLDFTIKGSSSYTPQVTTPGTNMEKQPVPATSTTKLAPVIKTDKKVYEVGETITISWSAIPGDSFYTMQIFRPEHFEIMETKDIKDISYTTQINRPGEYTVNVVGEPSGSWDEEKSCVAFNVVEKPASADTPKKAKLIIMQINNPFMTVDGKETKITEDGSTPVIINGKTFVPISFASEALGCNIEWNAAIKRVDIEKDGIKLVLFVGSTISYKDGVEIILESTPQIINGRTMVPARYVAEAFSAEVGWNSSEKIITIEVP